MSNASKKERANSARERAAEMRRQAEAKERRTRTLIIGVTTAIIAALIIGGFFFVQNARERQAEQAAGPAGLGEHGGLVVGEEGATATVTEFADFMCPACKAWNEQNGPALEQLVSEGKIKMEYVPVAILDHTSSGSRFSSRSASAAYCVMESDRDKYVDFNKALFANQPTEGGRGLTSQQMAEIAGQTGVSEAGQTCIADDQYTSYATKVTRDNDISGTPTIMVNGELLDRDSGQTVFGALQDAGVDLQSLMGTAPGEAPADGAAPADGSAPADGAAEAPANQ